MTSAKFKIDNSTVFTSEKRNIVEQRFYEVELIFRKHLGVELDILEKLNVDGQKDGFSGNEAIIPQMSGEVNDLIFHGFDYFKLDSLADYFGESSGSSNVTGMVVKHDLDLEDVTVTLAENGQLQRALDDIKQARSASDPEPMFILAYALGRLSLGWSAEKILDQSERFNKGNVAQDEGGIDGWFDGEPVQVRSGVWVQSYGRPKAMKEDRTFIAYTWNCRGEMVVYTLDRQLEEFGEIADKHDLYKSSLYSSNTYASCDKERPFRYLWW